MNQGILFLKIFGGIGLTVTYILTIAHLIAYCEGRWSKVLAVFMFIFALTTEAFLLMRLQ